MKRREFIAGLGGAAALPLVARAQQPPLGMQVIGYFGAGSPAPFADRIAAFRDGLRKTGFVEGRNVAIEFRWTEAGYDQLPALAAELVGRRVDVLVTGNGPSAAKSATATIPIVSVFGGDPVKSGYVVSFNRPGGNVTGVAMFAFSLGAKRLELLRELVTTAKLIAVLANPSQPEPESKADIAEVASAARAGGQRITILGASSDGDFEPAFAAMAEQRVGGLLVMADPYFNNRRERLIALASRYAIPAIYEWREMAA